MTARSNPAVKLSFEVHVQRDGRWLVADVFEDQVSALEYAERVVLRRDVGGVRVVRESYDPELDEAVEQVVFSAGSDLPKPVRWLTASLSGIGLLASWAGR